VSTREKRPLRVAIPFLKNKWLSDHYGSRRLRISITESISRGTLHDAFAEISRSADILLLCGDLTDYGLPEEAEELVADIRAAVRIPILAVLGNHDFESSQPEAISKFSMTQA